MLINYINPSIVIYFHLIEFEVPPCYLQSCLPFSFWRMFCSKALPSLCIHSSGNRHFSCFWFGLLINIAKKTCAFRSVEEMAMSGLLLSWLTHCFVCPIITDEISGCLILTGTYCEHQPCYRSAEISTRGFPLHFSGDWPHWVSLGVLINTEFSSYKIVFKSFAYFLIDLFSHYHILKIYIHSRNKGLFVEFCKNYFHSVACLNILLVVLFK